MDRVGRDTEAISNIAVLLKQDRNGLHLSEQDLDKALKAVEHVTVVLAKHSISLQLNKM